MDVNCQHVWERRCEYDSPVFSGAKRYQCSLCQQWGYALKLTRKVRPYTSPVTEAVLAQWKQDNKYTHSLSLSEPMGTTGTRGRWGNGMVDSGPGKRSLRPAGYESQREWD